MSSMPPSTDPGWYADPFGTGKLRWFDGAAWTANVHPPEQAADPLSAAPASRFPSTTMAAGHDVDPRRSFESERSLARPARSAVMVAVPLQALALAGSIAQFRTVSDSWGDLVNNRNTSVSTGTSAIGVVGQLAAVGLLVAEVVFLVWFYRAAVTARAAGLVGRRPPVWALLGFVIPVINFWFPYQHALDMLAAGHPGRRLVSRWWVRWIAASVVAVAAVFSALASVVVAALLGLIAVALYAVAAVAAREVVDTVTSAHADLVGAPSSVIP